MRHWGARIQRDTWRGYTGFIVEREGRRLLIGGDTAQTNAFGAHRRFGPFDAAVMPIGAYDPWIRNHCTPEQAVDDGRCGRRAPVRAGAPSVVSLSREPLTEPIERAEQALRQERDRLGVAGDRPDRGDRQLTPSRGDSDVSAGKPRPTSFGTGIGTPLL